MAAVGVRLRPGALALAAVCLLFASCSAFFGSSVPQRSGTLAVAGITAPVEVVRDRFGIPHITARNDHDLYFAQGFVHAQDRLFQMDVERRLARGELAELFGARAIPADRFFRHLGFAWRAVPLVASLPEKSRGHLRAYCDGVNASLKALRSWPVEHRILRAPVRPFLPEDVAAVGLLKSFGLAQWTDEAALYKAFLALPREKAEELMPRTPPDAPAVVPSFGPVALPLVTEGLSSLASLGLTFPRSAGSNAWAVSGRRSVTGRPILANDPHLPLPCPSLWYEVHLTAPGADVYGVSFPGAPGVVIGHNPSIAWGFTNAMLDDADFFLERTDGERVMFRKKWVPLLRRVETIRVRDGAEESLTVWETPHGPVLTPMLPGVTAVLSLRWVGYDGGDQLGALHRLNRARNRNEFIAALALHPHPAQNVVYADAAGNIGVVMAGKVPLRKGGAGLLPVPGDDGEWEWTGYLPYFGNPSVWNPPEGRVAAANFPPAGKAYPYYLSRLYEPPDRGRRILQMLSAKEKFSVASFERMQTDVLRPGAERAVALALQVARKRSDGSPSLREAARILSEWNLVVSADGPGAALYEVFQEKLQENLFRDDMGPALYEEFARTSLLAWNATDRIVEKGDSTFLDNAAAGTKETLEDVAARSLVDAMSFLRNRLGSVPATWGWGRLHQVTFEHPFGKNRYLQRWFNLGSYDAPGDGRTVFMERFQPGAGYSVLVGPSTRQVVPLGFRAMARSVITTGASGHFFEPHYRDQAPLWLAGRTHPAWTDPDEIEANTETRLVLIPAGGRK